MADSRIMIRLITPSGSDQIGVSEGTTVIDIVRDRLPHTDSKLISLSVNSRSASPEDVLHDQDVLVIAPAGMHAEVQMPKLQDFTKYLKKLGFSFQGPGPGDHEVWVSPEGQRLHVNRSKRDHKTVDKATVDALAKILNKEFKELYSALMSRQ